MLGGGQALDALEQRVREREGPNERVEECLDAARAAREHRDIAIEQARVDPAAVQKLLDQAALRSARGDLIDPPGANAFDKYRSAQSIDPANAEARTGSDNLPERTKLLFETALGEQQNYAAGGYLAVVNQLAVSDAALPTMRRRLAEAEAAMR